MGLQEVWVTDHGSLQTRVETRVCWRHLPRLKASPTAVMPSGYRQHASRRSPFVLLASARRGRSGRPHQTQEATRSSADPDAIGNGEVTQRVNVGADPAPLRELVAMVLPEPGRFGDSQPQARAAIDEITKEAQAPQPNPGRLRQAIGQILDLSKQAGSPLPVAYLTYEAQEWGFLPLPASGRSLPPGP